METEEEKVVRDADQDAVLSRAIEQIVRRALLESEERQLELMQKNDERQRARFEAVTSDIQSELRALRRVDEANDLRQNVLEGRVDQIHALNQTAIRDSVRAAVAEIFSPLRVLSAFGLLLGVLTAVLLLVDQFQQWGMS